MFNLHQNTQRRTLTCARLLFSLRRFMRIFNHEKINLNLVCSSSVRSANVAEICERYEPAKTKRSFKSFWTLCVCFVLQPCASMTPALWRAAVRWAGNSRTKITSWSWRMKEEVRARRTRASNTAASCSSSAGTTTNLWIWKFVPKRTWLDLFSYVYFFQHDKIFQPL